MSKTYKGYELIKALEERKIEEGQKFLIKSKYSNSIMKVEVRKNNDRDFNLYNLEYNNWLYSTWLNNVEIIELEDEEQIEIDSIEELGKIIALNETGTITRQTFIDLTNTINNLIKAVRQINKKLKEKE